MCVYVYIYMHSKCRDALLDTVEHSVPLASLLTSSCGAVFGARPRESKDGETPPVTSGRFEFGSSGRTPPPMTFRRFTQKKPKRN